SAEQQQPCDWPSISVLEQPASHHRFRYESEAPGSRLGGLLYGRSGGKSSCVRLRITGLDPDRHKEIVVLGGTVNPEFYPHPYYMAGDNCEPNGLFCYRRPVTATEMTVSLEKVSLICVGKLGAKLSTAIRKRNELGFNPYGKNLQDVKYTSRNLNQLRLAFQLHFVDKNGALQASPHPFANAVTDVVSDIKQLVKLNIDSVLPPEGSLCGGQDVWIYFKDPLPHEDKSQYQVSLCIPDTDLSQPARIEKVQKHLLSIVTPDLRQTLIGSNFSCERLRGQLVVKDLRSEVDSCLDIVLTDSCSHCGCRFLSQDAGPQSKRKRPAAADQNLNSAGDPAVVDALRSIGLEEDFMAFLSNP
ncbi:hypothetical protein BOX15_Mlig028098g1, partial [Macrostomum lignano]